MYSCDSLEVLQSMCDNTPIVKEFNIFTQHGLMDFYITMLYSKLRDRLTREEFTNIIG